jgi:hypothetical protein
MELTFTVALVYLKDFIQWISIVYVPNGGPSCEPESTRLTFLQRRFQRRSFRLENGSVVYSSCSAVFLGSESHGIHKYYYCLKSDTSSEKSLTEIDYILIICSNVMNVTWKIMPNVFSPTSCKNIYCLQNSKTWSYPRIVKLLRVLTIYYPDTNFNINLLSTPRSPN